MSNQTVVNRLIPLPKNCKVLKGVTYDKKRIKIVCKMDKSAKIQTALSLLDLYTSHSHFEADFTISLVIVKKNKTIKQLKKAKFINQSYIIEPQMTGKIYSGLKIKAYSDLGVLYGVRTLIQALSLDGDEVTIPKIKVADWPDMEFRGQWGGTSNCDIPYISQYKFNAIDGKVLVNADEEGNATVVHSNRLYEEANQYGIDIAATIPHLELIARKGFIGSNNDLLATPSEERKNRSDYFPFLCMSAQATKDMIVDWFRQTAKHPMVNKILIWLSEEESKCYCDKCVDHEPYSLEVKCLLDAYKEIRKEYPELELGIMLSQGSFKVTKQIADMLPKEVSLTFYDGGRTYDSGRYEMVLPSLLNYVKKGGLLGIYPQITHSWRTVFPMMSPYFIKYRCNEFVNKKLHRIISYSVPDNRYHDYNLLAFLEWLWNNKGRSEKEFTIAYATINNLDGELLYKYILSLKDASWDLAHSKLFVRLMYNYPLILRSSLTFDDHRFEMAEVLSIKNIKKDITQTRKAIEVAKEMKNDQLVAQAKSILGGLLAYEGITGFISELTKKSIDSEKLIGYYKLTKKASNMVYKNVLAWSKDILLEQEKHHFRVTDTSVVLFRALDGMKRYLNDTQVKCSNKQRIMHVGEWDEGAFSSKHDALLSFDITKMITENKKGTYHVCFDYIEGQSGTEIYRVFLREIQKAGGEKTISKVASNMKRVAIWSPWSEYQLKVKKVNKDCQYKLYIDVNGMEKGEKTCRGMVGLRKI